MLVEGERGVIQLPSWWPDVEQERRSDVVIQMREREKREEEKGEGG